jgi:hypothetical protein
LTTDTSDFDPRLVAAIEARRQREETIAGQAAAQKIANRKLLRTANSEAHLAQVLPAVIDDGDSWHVLSRGDVDALSFAAHVLRGMGFADSMLLSTWCMARPDLLAIDKWLDAGLIDRFTLCVGEIFPSQYGDEYELALSMAGRYDNARVIVARNHSKVTLLANEADGYYVAIESSANVNTNPRIEQTAVHRSRALHDFYHEQFSALRSIDKASAGGARAGVESVAPVDPPAGGSEDPEG